MLNEPDLWTNYDRTKAYQLETLAGRYEWYKNILKDLTIMSDVFMRNVLKKKECTEFILQVIMQNKELKILDQVIQKDYKNLQGRSAALDCVARDKEGVLYNIEIQQQTEGASPKRSRYHSGLMDMNFLNPGQDFDELPESYVIFITRDDVLGENQPVYHVERKIQETGKNLKDQTNIIYVNSKIQDDTELGRLMHDLYCKDADDMYSEVLAKRVRELKETPKGVLYMCEEMEFLYGVGIRHGRAEGRAEGRTEARTELLTEMVRKMLRNQEPVEKIQLYTGCEMEQINEIAHAMSEESSCL